MPSQSVKQQRLMGMAYAFAKGEMKKAPKSVKAIAKSFLKAGKRSGLKNLRDFAKTKHKGLPIYKESHIKSFDNFITESEDRTLELLEDFCWVYFDEYKITDTEHWKHDQYTGYFIIEKVSTNFFKKDGFPDNKSGYLVKIVTYNFNREEEFKVSMNDYIKRVCKTFDFDYQTSSDSHPGYRELKSYFIAFYNKKEPI